MLAKARYCMLTHDTEQAYNLRDSTYVLHLRWPGTAGGPMRIKTTGIFSFSSEHVKFYMCPDRYAHTHPPTAQINQGTGLGPHSYKAGQLNNIEMTALKRVQRLLKLSGRL